MQTARGFRWAYDSRINFAAKAPSNPSRNGSNDTCSASFRNGNSCGDGLHDFFIFFRFDAARAVDQDAPGFKQRNCRAQNAELLLAHSQKILRRSIASEDPRGGASRRYCCTALDQNPVERRDRRRVRQRFALVQSCRTNRAISTPRRSRLSCSVLIRPSSRSQATMMPWFFISSARYAGFPAGRRAGVEHCFARLGIEQHAGGRGAWVLM